MPARESPSPPSAPLAPCDCGRFVLDVIGAFRRPDVIVTWTPAPRPTTPAIDRLIDLAWTDATDRARRTGMKLYNGNLCRLIDHAVAGPTLTLTAGPTTFREFLGTNYTNPHLGDSAGPAVLASPLGVSAAVITTDGFIVLGRRSEQVAFSAGLVHPIGGMVELTDADRPTDPFDTILRELHEELSAAPPPGHAPLCLGLAHDKAILQPELMFRVEVAADVPSLRASARQATEGDEHSELIAIPDSPAPVLSFITDHASSATPIALAMLLLHGLHRWGTDWFSPARARLRTLP